MRVSEWLARFYAWYGGVSAWELWWLSVGFTGQVLFGSRFIVQWIVSERRGESVVPRAFWYLSIGGSLMLLTYAIWRVDPVFILGQATGCFIYVRNLVLLGRSDNPRGSAPA